MKRIDLNCDLGENFGRYQLFDDSLVLPYISSANVACGYHAGDALTMQRSVQQVKSQGVALGAHPGYPDLVGFGRRNLTATPAEVYSYVVYQVGALAAFANAVDYPLVHVKPHGAMYNMAAVDDRLADAIAQAVYDVDSKLKLVGLAGSALIAAGQRRGLTVRQEVFADRRYLDNGQLVPRSHPDALIKELDQAVAQVLNMVLNGRVTTLSGATIDIVADTLCVHGDSAEARDFIVKIRQKLAENNVLIGADVR